MAGDFELWDVWQPREAERSRRGVLTQTAAGFTPTRAGPGYRKTFGGATYHTGDGRVARHRMDLGFPEMNGRPPGCRGDKSNDYVGWAPLLPKRV